MAEGDSFEMVKVGGDFTVDDPATSMVFIAGGIGITPFRAILWDLHHRQQPINVNLLYANRNQDIPFLDELRDLESQHDSMSMHLLVEPERLTRERIDELVPDLSSPLFYVSGPEPMVAAIAGTLKEMGVDETRIKLDDFPGYETI
jgi:ferredoxin-NADP reductase